MHLTLLAYAPEQICLLHCTRMFHCTATVVYIWAHITVDVSQKTRISLPFYCHICATNKYANQMPHICHICKYLMKIWSMFVSVCASNIYAPQMPIKCHICKWVCMQILRMYTNMYATYEITCNYNCHIHTLQTTVQHTVICHLTNRAARWLTYIKFVRQKHRVSMGNR